MIINTEVIVIQEGSNVENDVLAPPEIPQPNTTIEITEG